ncbi:MerR family transcriptional regulator [Sinomonas albida]|uniref:MerR family transcriptional regulator n=1 Tax=Sinomonas albida TaxID=369942 RepID=UPI0010A7EE83|nr:MerR family transcriptional regulator [Sinomonas albida]
MQLRELSTLTGMPIASIKYYLREGILPAGSRVSATRSDYSEAHVRRIKTIQTLRSVNGLSVAQIRQIVALVDGGASSLEILKGLQHELQSLGEPLPGETGAGDAGVKQRGWPDIPTAARGALEDHLEHMGALGITIPTEALETYSRAVDLIANVDVNDAASAEDLDTLVTRTAVGMHMHSQLVLKLLALAQASRLIALYGPGPAPVPADAGAVADASAPAGPAIPDPQAPPDPLTLLAPPPAEA